MDGAIALVVALGRERRALQRALGRIRRWRGSDLPVVTGECAGRGVVLVQAGVGQAHARHGLLTLSQRFRLVAAWSLGFAGGLSVTLRAGDLVCPSVVLQDDARTGRPFGAPAVCERIVEALGGEGLPIHGGRLLSVSAPLRTPEAKRAAHRRTGAVAVDMEAAGVAEAAGVLGVPWMALKVVVDSAEEPLPQVLAGCTTARGQIRWVRLAWGLLASRECRRSLGRLGRAAAAGGDRLQRALRTALAVWSP